MLCADPQTGPGDTRHPAASSCTCSTLAFLLCHGRAYGLRVPPRTHPAHVQQSETPPLQFRMRVATTALTVLALFFLRQQSFFIAHFPGHQAFPHKAHRG